MKTLLKAVSMVLILIGAYTFGVIVRAGSIYWEIAGAGMLAACVALYKVAWAEEK